MQFDLISKDAGTTSVDLVIENLIVAGWTGRDREAMEHHISELEAIGVKRPKSLPVFYRCSASRLTQADLIEVPGAQSSGEIEFIFFQGRYDGSDGADGALWVGVASDHTEREVETVGVTISKQMCDKPVSRQLWRFDDLADHWDQLHLKSYIVAQDERVPYQDGPVTAMLDPIDLIAQYDRDICGNAHNGRLPENSAIFGGTLGAIGGIRPADRFEMELIDPVLTRSIQAAYDIRVLPVEG